MVRRAELTDKDMSVLREMPSFRAATKQAFAQLKDYSLQSTVELEWDLNEDAKRQRIFRIRINGEEALIDLEELLSYTRLV